MMSGMSGPASKASYTAASVIPAKIFCDDSTIRDIRDGAIKPEHVQVNPSNRCPLNCGFCSCQNRDKAAELDYDKLINISSRLIALGAKAFTITGGGDPLCYERLPDYVEWLSFRGVKSALVTNGVLFNKLKTTDFLKLLTWCRVSLSDERSLRTDELAKVADIPINWSFSYVLSNPDVLNLCNAIRYANTHKFSHIRVVDDIIGDEKRPSIIGIKNFISEAVDCSSVIWQGRKEYTRGHKKCLLSLFKPNVDVYGNLTGCCGIQFASNPPALDFTRAFRLCEPDDIETTYKLQRYFDGSKCERCYYGDYNNVLNAIADSPALEHREFK